MNPEALAAVYVALNFVSALLTITLSVYIMWSQGWRNALSYAIFLSVTTLYSLTNGILAISPSLEIASFFETLRWLSLAFVSPILLIFVLDYTGRDQWLTPKWVILYLMIPVLTQFIAWTNSRHGLMVQSGYGDFIEIGSFFLIGARVFGWWYWIHVTWGYLLILTALLILFNDVLITPQPEWQQFVWLLGGFLIPVLTSIVDTFSLLEPTWLKLLPFGFMLMGIAFFIAITWGQFITVLPVARGYLIETLRDAVIVIDNYHRIADLNPAAQQLIGKSKQEVLGKHASEMLKRWSAVAAILQKPGEISTVLRVVQDDTGRSYDLYISPLRRRWKEPSGWVIVLHDITSSKEAEIRVGQLAAVIEQANETVVITDLNGDIVYANPYFEVTTGYTIDEAIGKNPNIFQSGLQDKRFYQELWDKITHGEAWSNTFINKRKDGSLFYEAATIFPIKDSDGEIINYAAVKRDITERVIAEESFKNFTDGLAHLHEIGLELSLAGSFDEMCKKAVELGHERLKFDRIGIWFENLENPELLSGSYGIDEVGNIRDERDQSNVKDSVPILGSLLSGETRVYHNPDQPLRNHKGEIIGRGEVAVSPLWDGRKVIGYISIDNHISQQPIPSYQRELLVLFAQTIGSLASRKRFEAEIQKSEARYRLLADNVFDVIWRMDLQGHFTYVSPSVERLRGYSPEEVLQQTLAETLTPQSLVVAQQAMQEMLATIEAGERFTATPTFELEQPCKDGSNVWTEVITTLIYDRENTPLGILGVTRDISERKKADQELHKNIRQQELLNEITRAAIEQTDFQDMLQTLADRMGELLGADGCFITLWDEKKEIAIPVAAYGPHQDTYGKTVIPQPGEPTLTEAALKHGHVLVIDDMFNTPYISSRIAAKFPTRSGLALPLIANDQKLGAAIIAFNRQREYSQAEIRISQQAAQQIALAVLKAKLLDEAEQRAKEAETLRQTSVMVAGALKQDEAIERILEELNRVVPYDSASVLLVQGIEMEVVGARGFENSEQIRGLRFAVTDDTPNRVVFNTRKPYILEDAPKEYLAFRTAPHAHIRGWMGIPLLINDRLIGMLSLDSKNVGQFNQDQAKLASVYADQVAITLENARLYEETRRLAITDSLTNLFNRRHFMELARREFARAVRYKTPLSVIMLDIDHFKNINDTYGHLVGDQVLQTMAYICKKNLRSIDIIGRYGGEEFVILLPETTLLACPKNEPDPASSEPLPAETVAERLRQTIEQASFEIGENSITITISLGVAEHSNEDWNIENLINFADLALLQAKSQGRNRVVIWCPEGNREQNSD